MACFVVVCLFLLLCVFCGGCLYGGVVFSVVVKFLTLISG